MSEGGQSGGKKSGIGRSLKTGTGEKVILESQVDHNRGSATLRTPSNGRSSNAAAEQVGLKPRTAEKMAAVVKFADETGDTSVLDVLNRKNANSAWVGIRLAIACSSLGVRGFFAWLRYSDFMILWKMQKHP